MAQVIPVEEFARDGLAVERMRVGRATVTEVAADDETLVYVLADETVVWLAAGERFAFDGPTEVLVASARS